MDYRKTAEELHMTQPAVTQHIQYLEEKYRCKLFSYHEFNYVFLKDVEVESYLELLEKSE